MLKFFEVEESSQKVILLITSQEFNKVPSRRGPFLSPNDPLSYEDLGIPAVCVSSPRRSRSAVGTTDSLSHKKPSILQNLIKI